MSHLLKPLDLIGAFGLRLAELLRRLAAEGYEINFRAAPNPTDERYPFYLIRLKRDDREWEFVFDRVYCDRAPNPGCREPIEREFERHVRALCYQFEREANNGKTDA